MNSENVKLRNYLLGNLTKNETEKLDLRIISEIDYEEKLLLAEHALVEDYLEKNLTGEEIKLFQNNFLVSNERKVLLREVSLLKNYAQTKTEFPAGAVEKERNGFFQSFSNWLTLNLRPAAAFGLLIVGVLAFAAWQLFFQNSLSPLETEYAQLNQKDFGKAEEFQRYSNITLSAGTFRSANGAAAQSRAENLTESVFFRLALPFETKSEAFFKIELLKDGAAVFRQNQIRVYQNRSGQEIRLLLPKSVLEKGQYQIKLENSSNSEESVAYDLTIE